MLKPFLLQLINRESLTIAQCHEAIDILLTEAAPEQITAFLVLLYAKPMTAAELYGLVMAMRRYMLVVSVKQPVLDIVGTGGDGLKTVNISTAASIVAAACGVKVAKHGNRSVSSACGSADFLEACGIPVEMTPNQVSRSIDEIGIGFCFAPVFHPAMAKLKPIRNALKIPTPFNLLGPLLNPARAQYYLLGTADPKNLVILAEVLFQLKITHGLVVHSAGLDELSLIAPTEAIEVTASGLTHLIIDPKDYGFKYSSLADITGDTAKVNVQRLLRVFVGEKSALADTIIFNAGTALWAADQASSIAEGIQLAQQALQYGAAYELLEKWKTFNPNKPE